MRCDIAFRHDACRDCRRRCRGRARRRAYAPGHAGRTDHVDRRLGATRHRRGVRHRRPDASAERARAADVGLARRSRSLQPLAGRASRHAGRKLRTATCLWPIPARPARGSRRANGDRRGRGIDAGHPSAVGAQRWTRFIGGRRGARVRAAAKRHARFIGTCLRPGAGRRHRRQGGAGPMGAWRAGGARCATAGQRFGDRFGAHRG